MEILQYWHAGVFVVFCVVIVIQLFYYLAFFRRLAFYKPPEKKHNEQRPVSVIICARDEANNIVQNLPGVLVQNYRTTHEVILVNDNSQDETKYLIEELRKTFKHLVPVMLTQEAKLIAGKKFPLSMGIKTARYETLLLTDADCVPASENWIQLMQDALTREKEIVLGYGAYQKKPGFLNKVIRFETFHTAMQYLSYALAGKAYMGVGRNLCYKREVFFRNKGFSSINQIPGGDDDLFINQVATKENTAIVINPDAHTYSKPKTDWNEWFTQKYRHYSTAKYYKNNHKRLLGLYSATQFLTYPLLIISAIVFNWWMALSVFFVKLIVQAIIYRKVMKKLNELDLWPMFLVLDLWMCLYYLMFFPALFKRPKNKWN